MDLTMTELESYLNVANNLINDLVRKGNIMVISKKNIMK